MTQKCILIDSDVLIDVFAKRQPFYSLSAKCLELAEAGKFHAYTSPLIIANVFYVINKFSDKITAINCIKNIRQYVNIVSVDQNCIDQALNSDFTDFEDGIQNFAAENAVMDAILTRNISDYKKSNLSVLLPEEVVALVN